MKLISDHHCAISSFILSPFCVLNMPVYTNHYKVVSRAGCTRMIIFCLTEYSLSFSTLSPSAYIWFTPSKKEYGNKINSVSIKVLYITSHFSKLPKTFQAWKAILCAGYLPTEIQFSFILKTKK